MNTIEQIVPITRFVKAKDVFLQCYSNPNCYSFYSTTHRRLVGFIGGSNISIVLTRGKGFRLRAGFVTPKRTFLEKFLFARYGRNNNIWREFEDLKGKTQILFNFCDIYAKELPVLLRAFAAETPYFNYASGEMTELYVVFMHNLAKRIADHPVYSTAHPMIAPLDLKKTSDGISVINCIYGLANKLKKRYRIELNKYYHPMIYQTFTSLGEDGYFHPPLLNNMPEKVSSSNVNPNIYDAVKFLGRRCEMEDKKRDLEFGEYLVAIDNIRTSVPVDEYGWPLDVEPPKMDLQDLCANGPKATAGGVSLNGKKSLKTSLYYSTVDYVFRLVKKAETDFNATKRIDLPLMPYLLSPKAEIIKKDKKARNFTVIQAPDNLIETTVLGPILNASKATAYSFAGGRRIMNGTTLERGVGEHFVYAMLHRQGENVAEIQKDIKAKGYSSEYGDKLTSAVADYSSFEYQHHVVQGLLSYIPYWCYYNFNKTPACPSKIMLSYISEQHMQVDVDLGNGRIVKFKSMLVGSGYLLTLDRNGSTNVTNLKLAAMAVMLDPKYSQEFKRKAYIVSRNMLVQGDDCYFVFIADQYRDVFNAMITVLRDKYNNEIKTDVRPAIAKLDADGFDERHAGDFLKLKMCITKNGYLVFMRAAEDSMMRILLPNSPQFTAVTQYFSAISQMIINAGNRPMYEIAKKKAEILADLIQQEKIEVTSAEREEVLAELNKKCDVKNQSLIEFCTKDGFKNLDFEVINQNFLLPDQSLVQQMARNAACYVKYGMSYDALRAYSHFGYESFD